MVLTEEQVRALAAAARLGITEEEVAALMPALNRTGQYIAAIRQAPVPAEEPTIYGGELLAIGREDQVEPSWPRQEILRNAPQQAEFCFRTPRFLTD